MAQQDQHLVKRKKSFERDPCKEYEAHDDDGRYPNGSGVGLTTGVGAGSPPYTPLPGAASPDQTTPLCHPISSNDGSYNHSKKGKNILIRSSPVPPSPHLLFSDIQSGPPTTRRNLILFRMINIPIRSLKDELHLVKCCCWSGRAYTRQIKTFISILVAQFRLERGRE